MHHRHPAKLRKRGLQTVVNSLRRRLPVAHRVPHVGAYDDRAAFLGNQPCDRQILTMQFLGGVNEQNAQVRILDGAKGILAEVMSEGNDAQKGEAEALLKSIG